MIALPLGVCTAVYLTEYGGSGRFVEAIRLAVSNLSGVPSVIFGLFGLTFFVTICGFGVSLLSGVLTLAVLALPIVINTTEAALNQVPQAWREASLALGANKQQTIFKIILPAACFAQGSAKGQRVGAHSTVLDSGYFLFFPI